MDAIEGWDAKGKAGVRPMQDRMPVIALNGPVGLLILDDREYLHKA